MAVFASIRELLLADNPTIVPGVRKLVGGHFKEQWRQRQGDYRIFFNIDHAAVAHEGYVYKGTVHILAVLHRGKAYG
jgi:mRNA-degrading endonuclease RelE of RelBE toxin-antitoxin system